MTKDILTYKGYVGSVHYSADDEIFYGKIESINDLILFEGTNVADLKKAFQEAVEDYLATCKTLTREPDKKYKGSFNVRIAPDLHKQAAIKAIKSGISLNQFLQRAIMHELSSE
ncbi:MAG: type II toxin-antitoxin system HicB family antitoxin [Deltaproteobacteria bacterium]|nr:type II toxin-antitoxin system HicB family antitoxin [Deltaproteobacteria bacterium]